MKTFYWYYLHIHVLQQSASEWGGGAIKFWISAIEKIIGDHPRSYFIFS